MTIEKYLELNHHFTDLEKEISKYIIKHKKEILNMNIDDLAKILYVSKSAILRFCKKVEVSGFKELKIKLAQELNEVRYDVDVNFPFAINDDHMQIANKMKKLYEDAINDTLTLIDWEQLNQIANMIHEACVVDLYTHAHNLNVASNFQDQLLSIGKTTNCYPTRYNQRLCALHSNDTHIAIIISYSGKASFIEDIVYKLAENNTPIILIGQPASNYYPKQIKYQLYVSDKENLQKRISQFSSHISLQYIMDVLYSCVFNLNPEINRNSLVDKIEYMDDRKL